MVMFEEEQYTVVVPKERVINVICDEGDGCGQTRNFTKKRFFIWLYSRFCCLLLMHYHIGVYVCSVNDM